MVNYSILLCFDSMLSYNTSVQNNEFMKRRNQNQKFSFPFFAGPPTPPAERGIVRKFLVLGSRPKGACEAQVSFVKILRILPEIHSNFVQYTPPKLEIGIRARNGVGAKRRHKRIPAKNSRIQKVFPRSAWLTRLPIQFYE